MDASSRQLGTTELNIDTLRRLTQFLRDIGHQMHRTTLGERILSGLSEVSGYPYGFLYLLEREGESYGLVASLEPIHSITPPATLPSRHPVVQDLVQHPSIHPSSRGAAHEPERASHDTTADLFTSLPSNLAIPLLSRGRLMAFVVLQSSQKLPATTPHTIELLTTMAQSAANALDANVVDEELRQSQALMRRTDRLRSLEIIAGGFAHEIRNPLTSIKTFIQLAPERKNDSQFIGEFSCIVLEDVNRIERLIQEILDYARYMKPQLTHEDMNEIVSSCLYFIQVKADSRGIKIEKELAPELPHGMVDRQQIKQVLLNLLLNAMDAIGEKTGTIRVRTHRLQKTREQVCAQIEIEDTGQGIPADNLDHIFDPFFTTKHASAMNEGTGLGLTIAHQIIHEHHGEITVRSTEGIGTAFRITLPFSDPS